MTGYWVFLVCAAAFCFVWGYSMGRLTGYVHAQRAYSWALSFKAIGNSNTFVAPVKNSLAVTNGRYMGVALEKIESGCLVEIWQEDIPKMRV